MEDFYGKIPVDMSFRFLFFLFLVIPGANLFGREIINGYSQQIELNLKCIKNIENLLAIESNPAKKVNLKRILSGLKKKEVYLQKYFSRTEELMYQFQLIDPVLFNVIRFLRNKDGELTNVYIMVEPTDKNEFLGLTFISSSKENENECISPLGSKSVLIKLGENQNNAIHLAHEFGHIKYIVPNFAQYKEYYHRHYKTSLEDEVLKGHDDSDRSGHSAIITVKCFSRKYRQYYAQARKNQNNYLVGLHKSDTNK